MVYNAFDVYCFLSMSGEETFGLTVLEAMACGVPPIVPNFDGMPSVVGDAGLIADAENFDQDIGTLVSYPSPIDFSEKINLLLSNEGAGFCKQALLVGNRFPNPSWEVNLAGTEAPAERRKTDMKKNLRGKIREFVQSEEGKVGVKSPLTLGVAAGSMLLAHAIIGIPRTEAWECDHNGDCPLPPHHCSVGTCM